MATSIVIIAITAITPGSYADARYDAVQREMKNPKVPSAFLIETVKKKLLQVGIIKAKNCTVSRYAFSLDDSLKLSGRRVAFSVRDCINEKPSEEVVKFYDFPQLIHRMSVMNGYYDVMSQDVFVQY